MAARRPIRYAVVGQGWFAQEAVLPAFANARVNSELAALVSGDAEKRRELSEKYGVPAYDYDDYDKLLSSGDIQAVYVATPNSEHKEHTVRAARAGVHVLCEKPMAVTPREAQQMIDACRQGNAKLMIAYRLHFEEANLKAIELANDGTIGEPRVFDSVFTMDVKHGNIRLRADLGGGPLYDIGIYCINAARYLFRDDPVEVFAAEASRPDRRFKEVPEIITAVLRFPRERLATFTCGFGESKLSTYRLVGTTGDLRMEPAYSHNADLKLYVTVDGQTKEETFPRRDQIGPEIVYFSDCILKDREPEPNGLEGLADLRVIEGLNESVKRGQPVPLQPFPPKPRPGREQHIKRPAVAEDELVKADQPQRG
jgi:glucose-fructose oxidoreductase